MSFHISPFSFHVSLDFSRVQVAHPCNAWAQSAGYEDWASALEAMKGGNVISGSLHAIQKVGSKTMMGLQLFSEQIHANGLEVDVTEFGLAIVGLKSQTQGTENAS